MEYAGRLEIAKRSSTCVSLTLYDDRSVTYNSRLAIVKVEVKIASCIKGSNYNKNAG